MIGDYAAGGAVGAATALAVRAVVRPGFDVVLAMLAGMAIGVLIHLLAALFLSPVSRFLSYHGAGESDWHVRRHVVRHA